MFVRAYAYIRRHGAAGLRENSEHAVLNANYLRVRLRDAFTVPFDRLNMHEFVCRGAIDGSAGVRALDVSKRLLDYGFHPPTNYFPLIVPEALMIEPTETEAKPTLDAFVAAMHAIARGSAQRSGARQGRAASDAGAPARRGEGGARARSLPIAPARQWSRRWLQADAAGGAKAHAAPRGAAAARRANGAVRRLRDAGAIRARHHQGASPHPRRRRPVRRVAYGPNRDQPAVRACRAMRHWRSRRWSPATSSGSRRGGSAIRC